MPCLVVRSFIRTIFTSASSKFESCSSETCLINRYLKHEVRCRINIVNSFTEIINALIACQVFKRWRNLYILSERIELTATVSIIERRSSVPRKGVNMENRSSRVVMWLRQHLLLLRISRNELLSWIVSEAEMDHSLWNDCRHVPRTPFGLLQFFTFA